MSDTDTNTSRPMTDGEIEKRFALLREKIEELEGRGLRSPELAFIIDLMRECKRRRKEMDDLELYGLGESARCETLEKMFAQFNEVVSVRLGTVEKGLDAVRADFDDMQDDTEQSITGLKSHIEDIEDGAESPTFVRRIEKLETAITTLGINSPECVGELHRRLDTLNDTVMEDRAALRTVQEQLRAGFSPRALTADVEEIKEKLQCLAPMSDEFEDRVSNLEQIGIKSAMDLAKVKHDVNVACRGVDSFIERVEDVERCVNTYTQRIQALREHPNASQPSLLERKAARCNCATSVSEPHGDKDELLEARQEIARLQERAGEAERKVVALKEAVFAVMSAYARMKNQCAPGYVLLHAIRTHFEPWWGEHFSDVYVHEEENSDGRS